MPSSRPGAGDALNQLPDRDVEMGQLRSGSTLENGLALREEKKLRLKRQEEEEKAAYTTLMDLLERVEVRKYGSICWVVFELLITSGLFATLGCTLSLERWKHHRFLRLRMWQYVMMAIILLAGLSIIRHTTSLLCWTARRFWRLHRDLGYFLKEIKIAVDVTLWFCAVLFAWYVWFRPRLKHVHGDVSIIVASQITRFLIALCLGAVLWLGKNALFLWLVADLHYRQLCHRITSTIIELHVVQILHNHGMWRFLTHVKDRQKIQELEEGDSMEEEKKIWMNGNNICKELLWVRKETVPVLILQRVCEEYKNQIKLKPLPVLKEAVQNPEDLISEASKLFFQMKIKKQEDGDQQHDQHPSPTTRDDEDEVKLEDLQEKYKDGVTPEEVELVFRRFRGRKCRYEKQPKHNDIDKGSALAGFISLAGLVCCRGKNESVSNGDHQKDQSTKGVNETNEWRTIGRDEFCSWAVQAYRNCWGLESTLKSSEQIILKLNRMMGAFVLLLALIIWLLLSQIVDSGQIAILFSPLLAAKFIFSESTKNMFDGLIFALAMHPFNPGDRVIIEGMELLVTEINILSTTFYKYQTGEELVYPNSALACTQIINLELTPDQSDTIEFTIPIDTRLEDIKDLEIKIQMSLNERKDAFNSKVVKTGIGYDNIKMSAHFNYVGSYLTSELKAVHRSEMLNMIIQLVKKMENKLVEEKKNNEAASPLLLPSVGKPYIVKVTLHEKVKLKQVEDNVKPAIKRSLEIHLQGREHKVVMDNVADKVVRMAFYVWKKPSENDHELPQELISNELLQHLQTCISAHMGLEYECPNNGGDESGSKRGDEVLASSSGGDCAPGSNPSYKPKVEIQPMPGVVEIPWKEIFNNGEYDEVIKNAIKRYFYKHYYEDDFEVQIDREKKIVEIYAWRKFSHGIEKENQFPMEEILKKDDFKLWISNFNPEKIAL